MTRDTIPEYLKAADICLKRMDFKTFVPFPYHQIESMCSREWIRHLLEIADKTQHLTPRERHALFWNTSACRVELLMAMISGAFAHASNDDRLKLFNWFAEALLATAQEDPYAIAVNKIHTSVEVEQLRRGLHPGNPRIGKLLGRLINACYQLSYGLYGDYTPEIGYETYGPYPIGKNRIFVKRHFAELNPQELWPELDKGIKEVRVLATYEDVDLEVDSCTHAIFKGDVVNGLRSYRVFVNGKEPKNEQQLQEAIDHLEARAIAQWEAVKKLDFEETKEKHVQQRCYNFIRLSKRVGIDWCPQYLLDSVKDKPLPTHIEIPEKQEDEDAMWYQASDPREPSPFPKLI